MNKLSRSAHPVLTFIAATKEIDGSFILSFLTKPAESVVKPGSDVYEILDAYIGPVPPHHCISNQPDEGIRKLPAFPRERDWDVATLQADGSYLLEFRCGCGTQLVEGASHAQYERLSNLMQGAQLRIPTSLHPAEDGYVSSHGSWRWDANEARWIE